MDWSGVDYCDVFIRLSFWRHPFTAEHPLLRHWCRDAFLMKKQTHPDLRWTEDEQIFSVFGWAVSLSTRCRDVGVFMCILESRSCFGSRETRPESRGSRTSAEEKTDTSERWASDSDPDTRGSTIIFSFIFWDKGVWCAAEKSYCNLQNVQQQHLPNCSWKLKIWLFLLQKSNNITINGPRGEKDNYNKYTKTIKTFMLLEIK